MDLDIEYRLLLVSQKNEQHTLCVSWWKTTQPSTIFQRDHKSDKYFASSANLQEIQRTEELGELYHKHAINKIQTEDNATVMGSSGGNACQMPQVLQQINYKENKGMEGHCRLKEN